MATTNLNIRTDKEIKVQAEEIFSEEGRRIVSDPSAPRYSSIEALKEALEV